MVTPEMGCSAGGQGLPLGGGDGDRGMSAGRGSTVAPGYRGHPRRLDLVRAERGNPVEVRAMPGKPTGREAQLLLAGKGGAAKPSPLAQKAQENEGPRLSPSPAAPPHRPG